MLRSSVLHRSQISAPTSSNPRRAGRLNLPGVDKIVAVASGKGGVGKSTIACNLAVALSQLGRRVGLLDADIYGPSQHKMFGLRGPPSVNPETKELIPLVNYGVRVMSMGFLAKEDAPTIWRGPMVMGALEQLLRQVCWAPLDILVVDLPPGTGDAQLTLCQRVSLSGAIIVSTPQDIALIDARRGINMFRQVDVPLLGLIENMSKYVCSKCGHTEYVFGSHGAFETAREFGIPFLGEVPLEPEVRHSSDMGQPVILSAPDSPAAKALMEIAKQVLYALQAVNSSKPPSIEIQ